MGHLDADEGIYVLHRQMTLLRSRAVPRGLEGDNEMAKQAIGQVYAASLWHKPAGGQEQVFESTTLTANTDRSAIREALDWAMPLLTDEYTMLRVTRGRYQIRAVRMEPRRSAAAKAIACNG